MVPLLVMPRPANRAMLGYSAEAYKKAMERRRRAEPRPARDASRPATSNKYLNDIPIQDRAMPGDRPQVRRPLHRLAQGEVGLGARSA